MSEIRALPNGPRSWAVELVEGNQRTRHLVAVPDSVLDAIGVTEEQSELVVRESFAFLLEREPATAILPEFSLDEISAYFPEYLEEMGRRLG